MGYARLILISLLISHWSYAFTIDSLFKIDKENDRFFIIKNPESTRIYLSISLSELMRHSNGKYNEVPLLPESFLNWPIYIDPAEVVVDPDGEVRVNVIKTEVPVVDDRVIGITFAPDIVRQQEQEGGSSLAVTIGYKSWYVIPGSQDITGEPTAWLADGKVYFANNTNKVLKAELDMCQLNKNGKTQEKCLSEAILLSGNKKAVDIWWDRDASLQDSAVVFSDFIGKYSKKVPLTHR